MHKIILLIALMPLACAVNGQVGTGGIRCPVAPSGVIYGDLAAAEKAYRPAIEDTFSKPVVRLGYLYRDTVTKEEFANNLLVGLRMMRFSNYKIIGFHISKLPKGGDYYPGVDVEGSVITERAYREMRLSEVRPGDRIYFGAKVIVGGETKARSMNDVNIVIR